MFKENSSLFLNNLLYKNNFFDYSVYFFAEILPYVLIAFALIYFLFIKKEVLKSLLLSLVVLSSLALSEVLKFIFVQDRPFLVFSEIKPLLILNGVGSSFPSGHAIVFAALATAVYFENKKLGIVFFIGAFLIGISRVISGVHYLQDIVAGFLIGFLVIALSYRFIGKLRNKS